MLGLWTLAWVDKRWRPATGNLNKPLGGISTWIIGDFTQLLLVGDEPIHAFLSQSSSLLAQNGHSIYSLFEAVVTLSENIRQAGNNPEAEDGMKRWSHHSRWLDDTLSEDTTALHVIVISPAQENCTYNRENFTHRGICQPYLNKLTHYENKESDHLQHLLPSVLISYNSLFQESLFATLTPITMMYTYILHLALSTDILFW